MCVGRDWAEGTKAGGQNIDGKQVIAMVLIPYYD